VQSGAAGASSDYRGGGPQEAVSCRRAEPGDKIDAPHAVPGGCEHLPYEPSVKGAEGVRNWGHAQESRRPSHRITGDYVRSISSELAIEGPQGKMVVISSPFPQRLV
jgi:hypothetical protein